jgi:hypothetical protein
VPAGAASGKFTRLRGGGVPGEGYGQGGEGGGAGKNADAATF